MDVLEIIESLPDWEKAGVIRDLIPMLNLNEGLLMEAVIEHDREGMETELAGIEDHEFLRMYMDEHGDRIDLQEEISDRREFEWEYPQYK